MGPLGWPEYLAIYALLAALVAWFAQSRGRNAPNWFGWSLLISPLGAFIVLIFMGPAKARSQVSGPAAAGTPAQWARCSRCGEPRRNMERFCHRCGLDYWSVPRA